MLRGRRVRAALALALLLAGLVIRVVEIDATSYRPSNDAISYRVLAGQIAHSGDYAVSRAPGSGAGGSRGPTAYFAPAFPYFLAAVDLLGSRTVAAARGAQAGLGTAIVALTGLVALEAGGAAVGLVALAIAAVYPVFVELSGILVAENLLTALLLAAVWAVLRARRARRPLPWLAAGGVLLGLATLTHENAAVAVVPLAAAAWRPGRRRPLLGPAIFLLAAVLAIAPWTIRNAIVMHTFIPVSDETGITLRGTYNPSSAAFPGVPYKWRLYDTIAADRDLVRLAPRLTEPALSARLTSRALHYIARHPVAPLSAILHNSLRLAELEGTFAWKASAYAQGLSTSLAAAGVGGFYLLAVLALLGALTRSARRMPRWLWAVPVLLWLSVVLVNAETPRFREPIDPFLVILAACALAGAGRRLSGRAPIRRERRPAMAGGGVEAVEVREGLA